ncbi:MAG: hypothetical protein ACI4M6_04975 [Christensenellaceae bacterium]
MKKLFSALYAVFLLFLIACLIVYPSRYVNSSLEGIKLWAFSVLPSLLPFFFLTALLTKTDSIEKISKNFSFISNFLYRENGISLYVQTMSFLSGYPIGVKIISELKENGVIDEKSATKMSSFCSTSGPLFIVGAVGVNMFHDKNVGLILLLSHLSAAVLNGFIFKFFIKSKPTNCNGFLHGGKIDNVLYECAYQSVISVLIVGAFVAVFYVFCEILNDFNVFALFQKPLSLLIGDNANGFLQGLVECTKGCYLLSKNGGILSVVLAEGLISFGGLSIICQSVVFLKKCNASIPVFVLSKITQMAISMIVCYLILIFFFR